MHHSQDMPEEIKELRGEFLEKLGATGQFPDGKIHETDEGGINFAVAGDPDRNLVHIDFGNKPIAYVSMSPQEAVEVAQLLIKHARGVSKEPVVVQIH